MIANNMKKNNAIKQGVYDKISNMGYYGVINFNQSKRFNDEKFILTENLFLYRISKIRVFLGEKNSIIGIQAFYKRGSEDEIPGELGKDKSIKELDIKNFEIPPNDYICNMKVYTAPNYISKLIFRTKKGKSLEVGIDGGEDKIISHLNGSSENIILCLMGGYDKRLECINCKFCKMDDYLGPSRGFFELKMMMKHENFKQNINKKYENLDKIDKVLVKMCDLPGGLFDGIIKYCLY